MSGTPPLKASEVRTIEVDADGLNVVLAFPRPVKVMYIPGFDQRMTLVAGIEPSPSKKAGLQTSSNFAHCVVS